MMEREGDTIVAVSTPPGEGAIGIIRVSGPSALKVADRVFRGGLAPSEMTSHSLHKGEVWDPETDTIVDSVLLAVMLAPNSYTGEDMVEIYGHGGPVVLAEVLGLLCRSGAVPARRGEFSRRAVLNGRMTLSEAEAVLDLIRAKTKEGARAALTGLTGKGKEILAALKGETLRMLATVEACIDFPEEEITLDRAAIASDIHALRRRLQALIQSGWKGRLLHVGLTAAIVGKPNVGKSSLLNALLDEERAIVTPVPGTTRDYLVESIDVAGVPLKLIDTAGLREVRHPVEMQGVAKAKEAIADSDFVLVLLDWSTGMTGEDEEVLRAVGDKKKVLLLNKSDLEQGIDTSPLADWLAISAKYGHGLDQLRKKLDAAVIEGGAPAGDEVFTRARQLSGLERLDSHLAIGAELVEAGKPEEIVAVELRDGLAAIGDIAGETTTEQVLDAIFSEFCIGK